MASFDTSLTREEDKSSCLPGGSKCSTASAFASFETQGNGSTLLQSRGRSSCSSLGLHWPLFEWKQQERLVGSSLTSFHQPRRNGGVASLTLNNANFLTLHQSSFAILHYGGGNTLLLLYNLGIPGFPQCSIYTKVLEGSLPTVRDDPQPSTWSCLTSQQQVD